MNLDNSFVKTQAFLISGRAGVGKSTVAKMLEGDIFPLAHWVKKTALYMGWDGQKDAKGRKLLQHIGNIGREYDKNLWIGLCYGRDIEDSPAYPFQIIIHDDWRFPNELDFVKNNFLLSVHTIRIEAPSRELLKGTPEYFDESETSLPEGFSAEGTKYYDTIIRNEDFSLNELQKNVLKLKNYILQNERKI
jgi:hypothetical protein